MYWLCFLFNLTLLRLYILHIFLLFLAAFYANIQKDRTLRCYIEYCIPIFQDYLKCSIQFS